MANRIFLLWNMFLFIKCRLADPKSLLGWWIFLLCTFFFKEKAAKKNPHRFQSHFLGCTSNFSRFSQQCLPLMFLVQWGPGGWEKQQDCQTHSPALTKAEMYRSSYLWGEYQLELSLQLSIFILPHYFNDIYILLHLLICWGEGPCVEVTGQFVGVSSLVCGSQGLNSGSQASQQVP